MYISSGKLILTQITGIIALVISSTKVKYPISLFPVLKTFVAPILPEPTSLISFFKTHFVSKNPNGIELKK